MGYPGARSSIIAVLAVKYIVMKLSEIIKQHRKKSGLTQVEFARLAGVGKTVVFDVEHGKASVRLDTLLAILRVLNIKVNLKSPLMGEQSLEVE